MKINFKFLTVILSFMLCLTAVAFGQRTTGNIEGTIVDQNGAAVPGVTVTVKSTGSTTGYSGTQTTNDSGYYAFTQIPVGTYTVTTSKSGFKSAKIETTVVLDRSAVVSPALEIGESSVTVDVTSDSAVTIDPADTKIDTNITKQVIDNLPKGTQFTSLLKIAPNVRPEALSGGFQIDGASGSENVFVVDGQEVTNFRTGVLNANNNLPFELLQEVQIKSTGFEAEYGGATGGVINVITVGGNDSWRGNLGISFEPQKLQGNPRTILNRFGTNDPGNYEYFQPTKVGGTAYYPTVAFSGPIVKEKLWFSAIYAPQVQDFTRDTNFYTSGANDPVTGYPLPSNNPLTRRLAQTQTFSFKRKIEEAFVRLDAQPMQKLRVFGTFLWNPIIDQGANPGGTYGLSNSTYAGPFLSQGGVFRAQNDFLNNQGGRQNSNSVNGQITWTPLNSLVVNVRAGRNFLNEKLGSYGIPKETNYLCSASGNPNAANVPGGQAAAGCSQGARNFPTNFQINYDVSTRKTLDADAALVGINFLGRHNLKFGYQYNGIFNTTDQGYRDTGLVVLYYGLGIDGSIGFPATPGNIGSGYLQRFGTLGEASSSNQGVFVQDSWQIKNRLTLNLGIRAEKEKVPSFSSTGKDIDFNWGSKLAPRFGAAFDLLGDGKNKIFASYGWFYDRFKYELPRGSFGGDFYRRDYFEMLPARGVRFSNYSVGTILGTVPDRAGGNCPTPANPDAPWPTLGNGYSICQDDFRVPSNLIGGSIFEFGGIDPDIKAARQSEYTIGFERSLTSSLLLSARYTHKQLDRAIEDVGIYNSQGSEAYIIGNPGIGLTCELSASAGRPCTKAERKYDAVELRVDRRGTKWFFNASYTWSRLFGNYSGLASSDEAGRTSPNVSRLFDSQFAAYTAAGKPNNGRLATDRPHVFKAYGGYSLKWNGSNTNVTTFSAFTSFQSGTPLTTIMTLNNLTPFIVNGRGDLGRTEMFSETDFNVAHRYKFGRDNRFTLEPFVSIRNLFDEKNVLGVDTTLSTQNFTAATLRTGGCPATACATIQSVTDLILSGGGILQYVNAYLDRPATALASRRRNTFGFANNFQTPREVRFGARFYF
jgi:hypothetical protein